MILTNTFVTISKNQKIRRTPNVDGSVLATIRKGRYRSIMHTSGKKHEGSTAYHLIMCSQGDYIFGWLHNSKVTVIDRFETIEESKDHVTCLINKLRD